MNINHKVSFAAVGLLLLMSLSVFSQSAKIDSLKSIVNTEAKDTIMVSSLNNLGLELLNQGNIDESIKYSEKAKDLSTELGYIKGKALSLKQIGNANYYKGNYLEVFDYWTQSLENYEILKDSVGISNILSNLGIVYFNQGSNAEAIDYLLRSLRIAEKLKHPLRIATSLVNVAAVYADSPQDWDKALKYYEQVFPYLKIINDPANSKAYYFGVGEIEYSKGNYQAALKYFEEALEITKNTLFYSENLLLLGKTKFKLGEVEECISLLNQCYSYAVKDNNLLAQVKCLIELGIIYQNNNFKKAINSYKEAEILATDSDLSYELAQIYDGISQTYVNNGDFKKGYQYQAKYVSQKDSIFNIETNDKMRGLQFGFDLQKKEDQIGLLEKESEILELNEKRQKIIKYITFVIAGLILLLAIALFRRYKYVRKTNRIIEEEKNRSEKLLLNILPEETANELKENGKVQAKQFSAVTVLFTDFVGFTKYSENLSPEVLVETIGFYFSKFDEIIKKYGLEKIKTIGDAYMCAGGLPFPTEDHAHKMLLAAFEIAEFVDKTKKNEEAAEKLFDIRIGMNTGPVVAGVVGSTKFAYDIWGDTVNVASRMESMSEPGKINISENTYALIKEDFECEFRGEIEAKNRGKLKMYFVTSSKDKEVDKAFSEHKMDV